MPLKDLVELNSSRLETLTIDDSCRLPAHTLLLLPSSREAFVQIEIPLQDCTEPVQPVEQKQAREEKDSIEEPNSTEIQMNEEKTEFCTDPVQTPANTFDKSNWHYAIRPSSKFPPYPGVSLL